ncbi:MAG: Gfo/Idh/MocA family oxidoreductase, partial [Clostridia bacterium]|nr:Gfo/Idh/MocA family oxidoreductase [Clostridia bacterium]
MKKLNLAIIGQGRSGRDIHGKFLKSENNTMFNIVAVVERDPQRRERALEEYPGCEVFESYTELYGRKDIDLVTNASYSREHFEVTKDLIENGKVTTRAAIGVSIVDVTDAEAAMQYGVRYTGVYIQEVTSKKAKKAGLQAGDMFY